MIYDGFISYSHKDCGDLAPVIQKAIENIGKPWYKAGHSLNIYRDKTDLSATPGLWTTIENAIGESRFFILLASPESASSYWVEQEVSHWLELKQGAVDQLIIVLMEGMINWDRAKMDFDLATTDCLPKVLDHAFTEEPLWVDLRDFVKSDRHSMDARSAGFVTAMTMIIGRIVGKAPREIQSEELRRTREIRLLSIIGTSLLIALIVTIAFLFREDRLSDANAKANSLIAEANSLSTTNISKALLLYAYAYSTSKQPGTFRILNDFYRSNIFVDTLVGFTNSDGGPLKQEIHSGDTINPFFALVKEREVRYFRVEDSIGKPGQRINDSTRAAGDYDFSDGAFLGPTEDTFVHRVSIDIARRRYFTLCDTAIFFYDLATGKPSSQVTCNLQHLARFYTRPGSDVIVFQFRFDLDPTDRMRTVAYNMTHHTFDTLFWGNGDDEPYSGLLAGTPVRDAVSPANSVTLAQSSDGRMLFFLVDPQARGLLVKDQRHQIYAYDLRTHTGRSFFIPCEALLSDALLDFSVSDDLAYCYFESAGGPDSATENPVYDLKRSLLVKNLLSDVGHGSYAAYNEPTAVIWGGGRPYFVAGTMGGGLSFNYIYPPDDGETTYHLSPLVSFANLGRVNCLALNDHYIFVGNASGSVGIYKNPLTAEQIDTKLNFDFIREIRVGDSPIYSLAYDAPSNSLFVTNSRGAIFRVSFSSVLALRPDPAGIVRQIKDGIGIADLTREEKVRFGVK
jgi:TIR domain